MSLIRKHGAVLQAWACLDLVYFANVFFHFVSIFYLTRADLRDRA